MSGPHAGGDMDADQHLVIWHDIECGGYDVDLALWRELAE
jgi:hypothetical protein